MEKFGAERSLLDDQLDVLSHVERRRFLRDLLEENPQVVECVGGEALTRSRERRDLLIEMHHLHLPKLEAHGFIRWDRGDNVVTKGPQFEEIRPLIELLDENEEKLPVDWV